MSDGLSSGHGTWPGKKDTYIVAAKTPSKKYRQWQQRVRLEFPHLKGKASFKRLLVDLYSSLVSLCKLVQHNLAHMYFVDAG